MNQNEQRATLNGGFWGATRRDGALLLRSSVAPRFCTPGALHSARLDSQKIGSQQKRLRRNCADSVNRP